MSRTTCILAITLSLLLFSMSGAAQSASGHSLTPTITKCPLDHPRLIDLLKPENFLDELMYDDDVLEVPVVTPLARNRIEHAGGNAV